MLRNVEGVQSTAFRDTRSLQTDPNSKRVNGQRSAGLFIKDRVLWLALPSRVERCETERLESKEPGGII